MKIFWNSKYFLNSWTYLTLVNLFWIHEPFWYHELFLYSQFFLIHEHFLSSCCFLFNHFSKTNKTCSWFYITEQSRTEWSVCIKLYQIILEPLAAITANRCHGRACLVEEPPLNNLWSTLVPSKLRVFLCRLAWHSLMTHYFHEKRNMATTHNCSLLVVGAPPGSAAWAELARVFPF